ncbi:uncharacterized protein EI97DRAFT_375849 [Westerdykella ornata]|uniref:Zn(2)-C6 fungal-type domain-containing protein n=1 Tax=Westerdykella ornata TaxID=318751 RepID=A0A6A6JMT0_WESOR|nr:uncharacterized protein EI97DRAFT_375849 [Westerdykella ornata]KAF2277238.1 hypothetical protein EI97DRAFT_375849 [Westerdykella ornata]
MATPTSTSVPTRRPHQKSRLGCATCKKRRIKCDQTRPSCRNCVKRGLECCIQPVIPNDRSLTDVSKYLAQEGLSRVLVLSNPASGRDTPAPSPSAPSLLNIILHDGLLQDVPETLQSRLRHSLHHFFTATSATLAVDGPSQAAWPEAMLRLASGYPFIIHGVLALASLHLSRCMVDETEKKTHFTTATEQLNKGLIQYRKEIQSVKETNAEALFCFSTIASSWVPATVDDEIQGLLCAWKHCTHSAQRQQAISAMAYAMTKVLRIYRGVLIILTPHWYTLNQGVFGPFMKKEWAKAIPASAVGTETDDKLRALESLWTNTSTYPDAYSEILSSALEKLRECFALVSQLTMQTRHADGTYSTSLADWTSVFVWMTQLPLEFCSLLERQVPEAWVIYAHYAMLPAKVKGIWWLEAMPSNIVSTAALVLGEENMDLLDWPARCVGVELESFRKSPPCSYGPSTTLAVTDSV